MREFVPFDEETIEQEFEALEVSSPDDLAKLEWIMDHFENVPKKDNPSPAMIKKLDDDLYEIRHENGRYKGRLLFYYASEPNSTEDLVILSVFRKETQKTPPGEISKALKRMKQDQERREEDAKRKSK